MYCSWRSNYQELRPGCLPLIGLTPPQLYACHKSGHDLPTPYIWRGLVLCSVDCVESWLSALLTQLGLLITSITKLSFHNCVQRRKLAILLVFRM